MLAAKIKALIAEIRAVYDLIPYPRRSGITRFTKVMTYTVVSNGLLVLSGVISLNQFYTIVTGAALGAIAAAVEKWHKEEGILSEFGEPDTDPVE